MTGTIDQVEGKTVLLTGGTGSFGRAFINHVLSNTKDCVIRVFSRDELKQSELREELGDDRLRYMLGDVRDRRRLLRAAQGVDVIVHAAAMKQVPACEYNPFEAVQTNVIGAENIVDAAIDAGVPKVVALSTDKAVNPVNLYGATKLCAEKIVVQGNAYAANQPTSFSCVRYGNVAGSRGSVIPLFKRQREAGELTITDERMTRFWITLEQSVGLVLHALAEARGGEVFVPKIPSVKITDLAEAMAPGVPTKIVGIRPGEKLHESLITVDESRHTVATEDNYVVLPEHPWWSDSDAWADGKPLEDGWVYSSGTNDSWLGVEQIRAFFE
ncbi:MAG: UDP-N-acetylglucosamine 4,6-dehydratase/5-epimerase [Actinomycetota bacterium]|jgi:UDP-N-acetylglucosamine 4,6-dehydratase|nr:UDP-N-acetylglucosamine 4,6-dehydratase/5-epimerase [Actinomycetota bacterium]